MRSFFNAPTFVCPLLLWSVYWTHIDFAHVAVALTLTQHYKRTALHHYYTLHWSLSHEVVCQGFIKATCMMTICAVRWSLLSVHSIYKRAAYKYFIGLYRSRGDTASCRAVHIVLDLWAVVALSHSALFPVALCSLAQLLLILNMVWLCSRLGPLTVRGLGPLWARPGPDLFLSPHNNSTYLFQSLYYLNNVILYVRVSVCTHVWAVRFYKYLSIQCMIYLYVIFSGWVRSL